MAQPVYRARLVQMDGTVITTFDQNVIAESVTWTLNGPDAAELSFAKNALASGDLDVLVTATSSPDPVELQIIDTANGDLLLCWGPIISAQGGGSDGSVHINVAGVDWYLMRRFLDGAVTEYLTNSDFENTGGGSVFADWVDWNDDPVGTGSSGGFVADTNRVFLGNQSAKLPATGTGGGEFVSDQFITQTATGIAGGTLGRALVVSGWYYIGPGYEAAVEGRGLYAEVLDSGVVQSNNYFPLDSAAVQGKWQKASFFVSIPAGVTRDVAVRCYAGNAGTVWWDDIKLVQFDSFGFVDITGDENVAADIGDFVCHLVDCVQNTTFGKTSVNIATTSTPIGVLTMQTFQFSDHVQFDQAVQQFLEGDLATGVDYSIVYDAGAGTRTFINYNRSRGTDRSESLNLIYSVKGGTSFADRNCADYRFTKDGGNCITNQTVLGDDSGPDREEAIVEQLDNVGVTLQDVRQSPQGTEVRRLPGLAQARVNNFSAPPVALEMDILPNVAIGLIGTLEPGDVVTATIEDGWMQIPSFTYRIHQIKLNLVTNVMTVTLVNDGNWSF